MLLYTCILEDTFLGGSTFMVIFNMGHFAAISNSSNIKPLTNAATGSI